MSSLKLFLLGPPRLERDGVPIELDARKNVALLAYVAMTDRTHTREALSTLLWPELEPSRARATLRRNLSVLRKALGRKWLVADRETVGLETDSAPATDSAQAPSEQIGQAFWLDVAQFRRLLQMGREHDHPVADVCSECLRGLAEAVELYRGDFLEGFTLSDSAIFDEWQFFQTEGLRQELASALQRLVRAYAAQGEYEAAIPHARRWLALDPLHEPAHRCLMELYSQAGQRSAALRQYAECVRILKEELDLPPSEETDSLYEQIQTRPADREESLLVPPRSRHNLPARTTPFIGRETVLTQIKERLDDPACRLLTLVGPGGSGKTRLALEAATAQIDNYTHGVFFVSLAPLRSVEGIAPTVAKALAFSFYGEIEPRQQLLNYLRQKTLLLVMDNFEHLLPPPISPAYGEDEESTNLVADILNTAPGVKILVTSRARLNVQGEHVLLVAGMDLPRPTSATLSASADLGRYEAIQLFLASARRIQRDFELTPTNQADVARICQLVDGMPLGILLAAAWVPMLAPAEIVAQIHHSLDFLESDLRDVPERQRSIRATFDHSWRLLSEREREVLRALSVFRGGFSREAAVELTGASLRELRILVNKSFLELTSMRRYTMHELLRQYAERKLESSPEANETARDLHSAFYMSALQRGAQDLKGTRQQAALTELDTEVGNARAAWDWALERGQMERVGQGIEGLCLFYDWRGRWQEGEEACRIAADSLATAEGLAPSKPERTRIRIRALTWQGHFSWRLGHTKVAGQLLRQSLALLDREGAAHWDPRLEKAFAMFEMGLIINESSPEEARPLFEQSLALYRALGDRWGTAYVSDELGWQSWHACAFGQARQLFEESLAIHRSMGDHRGTARSLYGLGCTAMYQGQFEEGERLLQEGIALCRELAERPHLTEGLVAMAAAYVYFLGRYAEAYPLFDEAEAIYTDMGWRDRLALSNAVRGYARMHQGQYERARHRLKAGLNIAREIGHHWWTAFALGVIGRTALADGDFAEAQSLLEEAIALYREIGYQEEVCRAFTILGYAAWALGQRSRAREHLSRALQAGVETGGFRLLVSPLPGIALLLADQGEKERAVELYALASRYPMVAKSQWFEDVTGRHIAAIAATLPPAVVAAAQERGQARDLDATVAELLDELEAMAQRGC